jgi:hypothetical protein
VEPLMLAVLPGLSVAVKVQLHVPLTWVGNGNCSELNHDVDSINAVEPDSSFGPESVTVAEEMLDPSLMLAAALMSKFGAVAPQNALTFAPLKVGGRSTEAERFTLKLSPPP